MLNLRIYGLLIKTLIPKAVNADIRRFGSRYGGWHILADSTFLEGKFIIGGVGEDISFEIELNNYIHQNTSLKPTFTLIDPTSKSASHIEAVLTKAGQSSTQEYSNDGSQSIDSYDLSNSVAIDFQKKALWRDNKGLILSAPENPRHVSYSLHGKSGVRTAFDSIDVLELLETDESFSLLKLDIEGSELVVLQRLLQSKNLPKQILVEFDFVRISNLRMWSSFVMLLFQLKSRNYKVFSQEGLNISMVRDSK
jgi:hypothetical protein